MKHSQTNIDERVLKKVWENRERGLALYEYRPTLLSPFYCTMEPMRFVRRFRLLGEYLRKGHYKVYYLAVNGVLIGYNVMTPGGRRLSLSTARDVVTGPAYIDPAYRCRGYNKMIKRLSFYHYTADYDYVYGWVDKTNIPSIKSVEKMGFEKVGEVKVMGLRHQLVPAEKGACIVYRLPRAKVRIDDIAEG